MERSIDFSEVTNYDFDVRGADLVLKLFQGDIVTHIRIFTERVTSSAGDIMHSLPRTKSNRRALKASTVKVLPSKGIELSSAAVLERPVEIQPLKARHHGLTRLNEGQVREIRQNWDKTVEACGTKNAAAIQLAKVYNCSPKNIYAIIYRYSWAHL